jgi:site-specific DNA-methyltransferase (adenine-specific)
MLDGCLAVNLDSSDSPADLNKELRCNFAAQGAAEGCVLAKLSTVAGGNRLYFGDNLDVLREYVADDSVDLVYLDPPFNSQAHYNLLFDRQDDEDASAQAGAFKDTWTWGDEAEWSYQELMKSGGEPARFVAALRTALKDSPTMAYLSMMAIRLVELHSKLKPSGSLYLHCDPSASHYLKVILDGIFGTENFLNEVIWKRTSSHNSAKRYGPSHDSILFYAKSDQFVWNAQYEPYDQQYIDAFFTHTDEQGRRWCRTDLTGPGTRKGDSGLPWRHFNPTERGRHWQPPSYFYDKYAALTGDNLANYELIKRLDKLDEAGLIHWPKKAGGAPRGKRLLEDAKGAPLQDVWTDIRAIHNMADERIGYPTQKPLALMDRIISASTNPDAVILDPFCGCGTTIESAERSKRRWIGIDVAVHAIKVIEARLGDLAEKTHLPVSYTTEGMPRDFASAVKLAQKDKYQFQWWANYLFNPHALREQKKGADRGVDGELFFPNGPGRPWGRMLTSVKGGEQVGPAMVRDFARVLERERAQLGLFICLHPPTKEMTREATSVGPADVVHGYIPRLQIVAIEEWFKGKMPLLPPLEHLPSAAFSGRRRPAKVGKVADPDQPELPLSFKGGKEVKRHFNLGMVKSVA